LVGLVTFCPEPDAENSVEKALLDGTQAILRNNAHILSEFEYVVARNEHDK
jgi:hypothetical protein